MKVYEDYNGDFFLEEVCMTDRVKSWYIKQNGSRVMSTLITETPEGLAITGDFVPSDGVHSRGGYYSAKWFAGELSSGYLCEKFLRKGMHLEDNLPRLKREIRDGYFLGCYEVSGDIESFIEKLESIEEDPGWESRLLEVTQDFVERDDVYELLDGYFCSYDKRDSMVLVAIQRAFSMLYGEKYGEVA